MSTEEEQQQQQQQQEDEDIEVVEVVAAAAAEAEEEFEEFEESAEESGEEDDDEEEEDDDVGGKEGVREHAPAPREEIGDKIKEEHVLSPPVAISSATAPATTGETPPGARSALFTPGSGSKTRIKLTGLMPGTSKETLAKAFSRFGAVLWTNVLSTGTEPPFGLIAFKAEHEAIAAAREMDGQAIDGAVIRTILHAPTKTPEKAAEEKARRAKKEQRRLMAIPRLRLKVEGLAMATTTEALVRAFAKFGSVAHARIFSSVTGPYGLVDYGAEQDAANAAKEMDGKELEGSVIRISLQSLPSVKAPAAPKPDPALGAGQQQQQQQPQKLFACVYGLAPEMKQSQQLQAAFKAHGSLFSKIIQTAAGLRFGLVRFKTEQDAVAAVKEMNGKEIFGSVVSVKLQIPKKTPAQKPVPQAKPPQHQPKAAPQQQQPQQAAPQASASQQQPASSSRPSATSFTNKVLAFWDSENCPAGGGQRINQLFGGNSETCHSRLLRAREVLLQHVSTLTGKPPTSLQIDCRAFANVGGFSGHGEYVISTSTRHHFVTSGWINLVDASQKPGAVDIMIFQSIIDLMREFYENHTAPAALILISGDSDFIRIIQWCKAVQLPVILVGDRATVNGALVAEIKSMALGAYLPFDALVPNMPPPLPQPASAVTSSPHAHLTHVPSYVAPPYATSPHGQPPYQPSFSRPPPAISSAMPAPAPAPVASHRPREPIRYGDVVHIDAADTLNTITVRPEKGSVACMQQFEPGGLSGWALARLEQPGVAIGTELRHMSEVRVLMGAAGNYLNLDPRNPFHQVACQFNDAALSVHRIRVEKAEGDISIPIMEGDAVHLCFVEANLYLEVKAKKVFGGSPSAMRIFFK